MPSIPIHSLPPQYVFGSFREQLRGVRQLIDGVCRGNLSANTRLADGYHRVREADDVNTALQQILGHAAGLRGISDHYGYDGMFAGKNVESQLRHAVSE